MFGDRARIRKKAVNGDEGRERRKDRQDAVVCHARGERQDAVIADIGVDPEQHALPSLCRNFRWRVLTFGCRANGGCIPFRFGFRLRVLGFGSDETLHQKGGRQ